MPNNATVSIVGNFDPQKMMKYVDQHFGSIPRGEEIESMFTVEPEQEGMRRVTVKRESRSSILGLGFKAPHGLHKDAIALEVVGHLLTVGANAASTPLKQSGVVHDVMASWERMRDPYLFCLWATTNYPNEDSLDNAEKSILKMLHEFEQPSEDVLKVAKKSIEFEWRSQMEGTQKTAMAINEAIARGDPFDVFNRFVVLEALKPEDIIRVCKKYFDEDKLTVVRYLQGKTNKMSNMKLNYKSPEYETAPAVPPKVENNDINFTKLSTQNNGITFTKYANTNNTHIMVSLESPENEYTAQEYVKRMVLGR